MLCWFGLLFINPLGNTVIRKLSVTETAYGTGLTECWGGGRSDMLCSGSGAVVVFDDTNITDQLVKVGNDYMASLSFNESTFYNNSNWMPIRSISHVRDALIAAYKTERIPMTGGLSLAILYMGQRSYLVDVYICDTSTFGTKGIFPIYL